MVGVADPKSPKDGVVVDLLSELERKLSVENQDLIVSLLQHMERLAAAGTAAAREAARLELAKALINVPRVRTQVVKTVMACLTAERTEFLKIRVVDDSGKTTGWEVVTKTAPDYKMQLEAFRIVSDRLSPKAVSSRKKQPYLEEEQPVPENFLKDRRQAQS